MSLRAVIFDVYGTLLELTEPVQKSEADWTRLYTATFGHRPPMSFVEVSQACERAIMRQHALSRSRGVLHPEIVWPSILSEVLPDVRSLTPKDRDEFIYRKMQLSHTSALSAGAAGLLAWLRGHGCLLGIASNGQAYTVRELTTSLAAAALEPCDLFEPSLCFWSFEHGFSKPDPHVFQILTIRCEARGIAPNEILMVGDRVDNDLEPARRHGWATWWLKENPGQLCGGTWDALRKFLATRL